MELFEIRFDRGLVYFDLLGSIAGDAPASRAPSFWRQLYEAMLLKMQKKSPANHVLGLAVGLDPVPCQADLSGKRGPMLIRVSLDQVPDECNIPCANGTASVDKHRFHMPTDT